MEVGGPFKIESKPYTIAAAASESQGGRWIILSALIGLGVVAAGVALYKKTA